MNLRLALPNDILRIIALESAPGARHFVGQWSEQRHQAMLGSDDVRYFVDETPAGELEAYAILRGLAEITGAIELKRIVVGATERGLGRRILQELIRIVFDQLRAHRLFLDVYEDNARARHLYESLGFVYEGVMRDAAQRDGTFCNLCLMSMLEHEYAFRKQVPAS